MNRYLQNLERIEFVVTMACTGSCIHCSEGEHDRFAEHIDAEAAAEAVRKICTHYRIASLMTFGGESLLYPEVVCRIHREATDLGIPVRQLITNGYFSKDRERIRAVTLALRESGVNDLLLSADAFHQETIPLEPVLFFARCAADSGIPIRLQPAWLVSPEDRNPYNDRTREILRAFDPLGIPRNSGNVIFPMGNARKSLRDYFPETMEVSSPYDEDPEDLRTVSIGPNGDVLGGNLYETDILELIRAYSP